MGVRHVERSRRKSWLHDTAFHFGIEKKVRFLDYGTRYFGKVCKERRLQREWN